MRYLAFMALLGWVQTASAANSTRHLMFECSGGPLVEAAPERVLNLSVSLDTVVSRENRTRAVSLPAHLPNVPFRVTNHGQGTFSFASDQFKMTLITISRSSEKVEVDLNIHGTLNLERMPLSGNATAVVSNVEGRTVNVAMECRLPRALN